MESVSNCVAEKPTKVVGTHKHKCPNPECCHVWEHGDDCKGIEEEHVCPKCNTIQWTKYYP